MQAAATATLWHRRMGHLNRKSLDLLKKVNNNEASFDGTVLDCVVCAVGKSRQRAHPKTADQHVQHPFQLVFTDITGQFTPEALEGYRYVSKISDEHTRWTEIYLHKSEDGAPHAFQSFAQSMVIPSGVRVERLRADKGEGPQLLMQELPPGGNPDRDNKGHNYITDDDFIRDLRSYTSVVDHPGSASTDHVTASRRSENTSVGEKMEVIPNTFKKAMTLPAKAHWKAASDKEVTSLKMNNVYTLVPATAVPAGYKIIGSHWVYKVKADKSYKGRVVVPDGDKYQASTAEARLLRSARFRASVWCWR